MDLADATAAPLQWKGHELHPLKLKELGEFERWAKAKVMGEAREIILDPAVSAEKSSALLDCAYARAAECTIIEDAGAAMLQSVEGMLFIIWLSLKKGKPEMTLNEAEDVAGSVKIANELTHKILTISGFFGEQGAKKNGEKADANTDLTPAG